jgi:hypothetical protein
VTPWLPLLAVLIASEAPEPEASVKISLSRTDPNASSGVHATTDLIEFFVFADGMSNRGGEFGLVLEGGQCLGFLPDEETAWVVLPGVRPYPGTISQAVVGEDCPEPPLCYGRMFVKPSEAGKRIVVDVIPSERSQDVAILRCDNNTVGTIMVHPAVVNGGQDTDPTPHVLTRPPDAPPLERHHPPVLVPLDDDPPPEGDAGAEGAGK